MGTRFSEIAADVSRRSAPQEAVARALSLMGARADLLVDDLDADHRIRLVGQFVRGLRNIGVHEAARIERDLYEAVGAGPTSRRPVVVKDAISLVAVRNHVQQLTTALGVPWATGMQIQSAISDVARFVAANGGGQIDMEADADGLMRFAVRMDTYLPMVSLGAATPPWLVGVAELTDDFRMRHDAHATHIQIKIGHREALVA